MDETTTSRAAQAEAIGAPPGHVTNLVTDLLCCLWCGADLPLSTTKPRKYCDNQNFCKMAHFRWLVFHSKQKPENDSFGPHHYVSDTELIGVDRKTGREEIKFAQLDRITTVRQKRILVPSKPDPIYRYCDVTVPQRGATKRVSKDSVDVLQRPTSPEPTKGLEVRYMQPCVESFNPSEEKLTRKIFRNRSK
jgi:hypothetical protein